MAIRFCYSFHPISLDTTATAKRIFLLCLYLLSSGVSVTDIVMCLRVRPSSCMTGHRGMRLRLHLHPALKALPLPLFTPKARSAAAGNPPSPYTQSLRSLHSASALSKVAVGNFAKSRGPNLCRSRPFSPTPHSTISFLSPSFHSQSRQFSSTQITMTATKIDGTAIARSIRQKLQSEIQATQKINPRYKPSLKIFQGKQLPWNVCAAIAC